MALPEDFNKIYGSTATGGLTPIGDVNYAKGWEFVGSNPPTKNDFSYLQNLSDLKSQWLYSNKLQRTNPFGDIKDDGAAAVSTALANIGFSPTGQDVCSAWCVFNGTSGVIISSYNISSISKNAVGNYTARFTSPRKNASFTVVGSAYNRGGTSVMLARVFGAGDRTTTAFGCYVSDNNTDSWADSDLIEFAVFGGKP